MCIYRTACRSCRIPAEGIATRPRSSARTQPSLLRHSPSVRRGQPSAVNVPVQLSASQSRHLPSSSTSHWGRTRAVLPGGFGFLLALFYPRIWNQRRFHSLFSFSCLAEAQSLEKNKTRTQLFLRRSCQQTSSAWGLTLVSNTWPFEM